MEKKTYEAGASAYTLGVANSILNYADEYGQASKAELENMPKDASVDQWKKKMEEIAEEFCMKKGGTERFRPFVRYILIDVCEN